MIIDGVDTGWTTVTVQEPEFTTVQAQSCFSTVAQIQVSLVNQDLTLIADYPRITTVSFDATSGFELRSPVEGQVLVSLRNINPLYFSTDGDYRVLTHYIEDGSQTVIRKTEVIEDKLKLTLASFTPTIIANGIPGNNLMWDQVATGFRVSIQNPPDFPDKWISELSSLDDTAGWITQLDTFVAGEQSPTPGSLINWSQDFTTDAGALMRPYSTTIAGGQAAADLRCNYTTVAGITAAYPTTVKLNINWATPATVVTIARLSGATFLETYASVGYTVSTTGLHFSSNAATTIIAVGGTASNPSGSGVLTFDIPVHKDSVWADYKLHTRTDFTRPVAVTGTAYTVSSEIVSTLPPAQFTYPSAIVTTPGVSMVPTTDDFVSGSNFAPGVRVLDDSTRTFAGYITNDTTDPLAAWFAIRANVAQPTVFRTGISPSLLNNVSVTTGNTIALAPQPEPTGYIPELYKLYGITLQPGVTYVSIS